MKHIWIGMIVVLLLVGCSSEKDTNQMQPDNNDTSTDEQTTEDEKAHRTGDNEPAEEAVEVSIKDVQIRIYDQTDVRIEGEIKTSNNLAYYRILHDKEIVSETKLELDKEGWTELELEATLPEAVVKTKKVPVLEIYGKNAAGKEINPNYFAIDFIRQST